MLTPQEIKDKQFTKAVFGGYDMASVDDFLEEVEETVEKLQKENAILKSKMKLLVEKIEEYRASEDSMRMALAAAKKTADEMVNDAEAKSKKMLAMSEAKSKEIVSAAEAEAAEKLREINTSVYAQDAKLQEAKKRTEDYVRSISKILDENKALLNNIDKINAEVPAPVDVPKVKEPVAAGPASQEDDEPKVSFESSVFESAEKSIEENDTEPAVTEDLGDTKLFKLDSNDIWDDVDEPTSPRPKFDFSDLRFGTNYFGDSDE